MKKLLQLLLIALFAVSSMSCIIDLGDLGDESNTLTLYNETGWTIDNVYIISATDYAAFSANSSWNFDDMAFYYTDKLSYDLYDGYSATVNIDPDDYDGYYLVAEDIYGEYYSDPIYSGWYSITLYYSDSEGYE